MNQNNVVDWLQEQFMLLEILDYDLWLIGSLAAAKPNPKDCDLLLIAPLKKLESKAEKFKELKEAFFEKFNLPLHLTIISSEELEDSEIFLEKVFQRPCVRL